MSQPGGFACSWATREFFPEFMHLFLPKMAKEFDFDTTVWLDKEILPDPPEGGRHILDLVAKLRTVDKHRLPVLPIVLYLSVGMDGIGEDTVIEYFGDWEVMRFRYLYVGLKSLDALEYASGDNWLGVALSALMIVCKPI